MPTHQQRQDTKRRLLARIAYCYACRLEKPWEEFGKCPYRRPFGLSSCCNPCDNRRKAISKEEWYYGLSEEDRHKYNRRHNLSKFGITLEQYDIIQQKQNGVCEICKKPETSRNYVSKRNNRLAIDHDHKTGKIRGLLCHKCNKALGSFQDSEDILTSAIKYLRCNLQHTDIDYDALASLAQSGRTKEA